MRTRTFGWKDVSELEPRDDGSVVVPLPRDIRSWDDVARWRDACGVLFGRRVEPAELLAYFEVRDELPAAFADLPAVSPRVPPPPPGSRFSDQLVRLETDWERDLIRLLVEAAHAHRGNAGDLLRAAVRIYEYAIDQDRGSNRGPTGCDAEAQALATHLLLDEAALPLTQPDLFARLTLCSSSRSNAANVDAGGAANQGAGTDVSGARASSDFKTGAPHDEPLSAPARALALLVEDGGINVSELARRVGVARATIYRSDDFRAVRAAIEGLEREGGREKQRFRGPDRGLSRRPG